MKPYDVYHLFDVEPVSAKGCVLHDAQGKEYLDFYGGHAVISVGHSHPKYVEAITRQLNQIGFYSNSVQIDIQKRLAEKLGRMCACPEYGLFLCNSGAEANENAMKLASFKTGRKKIIAMKGSFHGRTSLAVAATDNPLIRAMVNQVHDIEFIEMNAMESLSKIDGQVAAVIIEGIQGVAGIFVPENGFLQALEAKCKEAGSVLILDEVQSGYGRTGQFFAHQSAGIRPDLITVAKGMGNGFPVAAVLVSPEFAAVKESLGTTFGGNYLACAAALSVLDILEEESLMDNSLLIGQYLVNELSGMAHVNEVRGRGLMIGLSLDRPATEIRKALLNTYGIFTGSASAKDFIRLLPPLNVSMSQARYFVESFKQLMSEL